MKIALPLAQMSVAEKIEVMEAIWSDLSAADASVESPAWHGDVLAAREAALRDGREVPVDWESAKRKLRELRA